MFVCSCVVSSHRLYVVISTLTVFADQFAVRCSCIAHL